MVNATAKRQFLAIGRVTTSEKAAQHSLQAALATRRGKPVYVAGVEDKRVPFRAAFAGLLFTHSDRHRQTADENAHIAAIESISAELTRQYAGILCDGCLRIGIAQKAFNLYLKYMWCLVPSWPVPPHCPIDGIILQAAGVFGSWTSMNSLETYNEWIARLRTHAQKAGYSSLAEWELDEWERSRAGGIEVQ